MAGGRALARGVTRADAPATLQAAVFAESWNSNLVFEQGRYRWTIDVEPWRDPSIVSENPQPQDPSAAKMYAIDLQMQWGDGSPRNRLHVQSLRLVAPTLQGGMR